MRTVSIRTSLLRNVLALVLSASVIILIVMFAGARSAVRELSEQLIEASSARAAESMNGFFRPIESILATSRAWSDDGLLRYEERDDLRRLNAIFAPMLRENPQISSMMVAGEEGFEYLLFRDLRGGDEYEWFNRITSADRGPDAGYVKRFTSAMELHSEGPLPERARSYDVRTRPFYAHAAIDAVHWTDPYYFFTTRDAGMTVSMKWRDPDSGKVKLVAFDLLLMDLSSFTSGLLPSPNGRVFVMHSDGSLLGLPADERWKDSVARREILRNPGEQEGRKTRVDRSAVLETADALELPAIGEAVAAWRRTGEDALGLFRYSSGDEWWWGGVRPFQLHNQRLWIGVVVPENDFLDSSRQVRDRVLMVCALALLAAAVMATLLARRYSAPLEFLAQQTARVRELDLAEPLAIRSHLTEVDQLANANAQMLTALDSFSRYVPLDLVRELLRRGEVAEIGGRSETLTILFTDIQGFTKVAEGMSPQALTVHMAEYFSAMLEALQDQHATVDKFVGDAIVAFWGAPAQDENHAQHAVRAVQGCREALARRHEEWTERGLPLLPTRFGLCTGEAVVGNVGAPRRLNYTILGDSVNMASRLEAINARYGTTALATQSVVDAAGEGFAWRRIDRITVKGKLQAVTIYEPLGEVNALESSSAERARRYESALDLYAEGRFAETVSVLEELLVETPDDGPAQRLVDLARHYAAAPPSGDWNGVTHYDTKS